MFGLDYLLSPCDGEDFLNDYWGLKALYVPGEKGKFGDLFGWEDINHIMTYGRMRYPDVRLVQEKNHLPQEALSKLDHWLTKGATLVVNSIQRLDPVVDRFASALANEMNSPININSYTSWPAKQGFDTHYDRHDVFVVQVAGCKTWTVAAPTHPFPVEQEAGRLEPPQELDTYLECELSEGDVLYIPRGHWHFAVANTPSIHLTVGTSPRTGVDFLTWLAERQMARDDFFRRDLPLPRTEALAGNRQASNLEEHWDELVRRLQSLFAEAGLREEFLQYCMTQNRPIHSLQLPELVTLREDLTMETPFVMAPDQKALVAYKGDAGSATVTVRGKIIKFENLPEGLLDAFLEIGGRVSGADLLAVCPDLEVEQVKRFLLEMFENGILRLAEPAVG